MNFLDKTLSIFGYTKGQQLESPPRFLSAYADRHHFWRPNPWTIHAQVHLYKKVSAIRNSVNAVAAAAASTSASVKQRGPSDGKKLDIDDHDFERLIQRPNPMSSRYRLLYDTWCWRLITGNCYWWLNRPSAGGPPVEVFIIPPDQIRPIPDGNMFVRGYFYDAGDGVEIPLDVEEVCHFGSFNPSNMFVGMSELESIEVTAYLDKQANEWNRNFFAKDNAKPSGALTFADPIDDHSWKELQSHVTEEYGGTKRQLMLLRGVGQGAVNFVPMSLSQNDMQFLETREYNQKEIFDTIAPGLQSMLSESSNVATSQTGKDSFYGLAVYPRQIELAEKITNDIMPMYGDDLFFEFGDVRQRDRKLELEEIGTFALTHTIDEVRAEWYEAEPIGDERGELLIAEVTQSQPEPQEEPEDAQEPPQEELSTDAIEDSLKALLDEVKALKSAIPQPVQSSTPTTVTINQSAPIETEYHVTGTEPTEQITGPTQAQIDLELWQKKAKNKAKKGRSASVPFESDNLSTAVKAFVSANLDQEDIDTTFSVAKAMLLQLDPDDDEAEQKARMQLEDDSTDAIEKALGEDFEKFQRMVESGRADASEIERILSEMEADSTTKDTIRRMLIQSTDLGVSVALQQLDNVGIGFDWTLANADARDWANQYVGELIAGINATTRRRVQQSVSEWVNNGDPLSALVNELSSTFGRQRAEMIASTEVTNAYALGSQKGYIASGVVDEMEIQTAADERVCPTCGPKQGTRVPVNASASDLPSFHVKCRCWVAPVIK